ncbi:MAG: HlyD family efflux transporter periplasmic adaptor subunit [Magnetococcales bacterium]|nr:HlyD family efflux transporter periplasmic adaptor subunit [Magnetococcales bacterium]
MSNHNEGKKLPPLRNDLILYSGPARSDGSPTWTIYDPIRHRFFRLGWIEHAILSNWAVGKVGDIIAAVHHQAGLLVTQINIGEMLSFLTHNDLLLRDDPTAIKSLLQSYQNRKPGLLQSLLHNYLFFRIPLIKPDRFLQTTLPLIKFFYSRVFLTILGLLAVSGLYLTARQLEAFTDSFLYFFNIEGLIWYGGTIFLAKSLHELGHAYTARYYGCPVPIMGIAFLVMWPVLYTDTSGAWKLSSRRARLAIGGAGMAVELSLAVLATFLWHFLPEGAPRSGAVLLATVTWFTTLLVNLNPFMRFDGYYLLADYLGMANLQERSFALARWRLREILFGFGKPPPELFTYKQQQILLLFAYGAWLYRLLLFIGIALLVYHMFFKLAGIILMAVEIAWFIGRPLKLELSHWWKNRQQLHWNRNSITTLLLAIFLLTIITIPWQGQVEAPAIQKAKSHLIIYPSVSAQVQHVFIKRDQHVAAGELLIKMHNPDLQYRFELINKKIAALQWEIDHAISRRDVLQQQLVIQEKLLKLMAEKRGIEELGEEMKITAPFSGVVVELQEGLYPGRWCSGSTPMLELTEDGAATVEAVVSEEDIGRITPATIGTFYPDHPEITPFSVRVLHIYTTALSSFDEPFFASLFGGSIPAQRDDSGAVIPVGAYYRLILEPTEENISTAMTLPGRVVLATKEETLLQRLWTTIAAVLIRESGF